MRCPLRRFQTLIPLFTLLAAASSFAGVPGPTLCVCGSGGGVGVPDPGRSNVAASGATAPCQYRFRADGGLDQLAVAVTLRDPFDAPIPGVDLDLRLDPAASSALCGCGSLTRTAQTGPGGDALFVLSRLGGRGSLDLSLTVTFQCDGSPVSCLLWTNTIDFTSPDLDGSCEASGATNVFDLGVWAGGLSPAYLRTSDYDCNGVVNVFDLGVWAGGLAAGCSP